MMRGWVNECCWWVKESTNLFCSLQLSFLQAILQEAGMRSCHNIMDATTFQSNILLGLTQAQAHSNVLGKFMLGPLGPRSCLCLLHAV